MSRFIKLNGKSTTEDDNERGIWYSAQCGYWTDDWTKVCSIDPRDVGIPCCPICSCPGYQTTWKHWFDGAKGYEDADHPWYCKFLLEVKEKCHAKEDWHYEKMYQEWAKEKGILP